MDGEREVQAAVDEGRLRKGKQFHSRTVWNQVDSRLRTWTAYRPAYLSHSHENPQLKILTLRHTTNLLKIISQDLKDIKIYWK